MRMKEDIKLYEITTYIEDGYLHASITGSDSPFVTQSYFNELCDICEKEKLHNVIVEEDLEGNLSITELYDVANLLTRRILDLNLKIAFYDHNPEHWESNKFAETVSVNLGWNIKLCRTLDEAKDWLVEKSVV